MASYEDMSPFDGNLTRLPRDLRRNIWRFMQHPTAQLIKSLQFDYHFDRVKFDHQSDFKIRTAFLKVSGDGICMCMHHDMWSGEALDASGHLRRHKNGRIDSLPNGRAVKWGHTRPSPPP